MSVLVDFTSLPLVNRGMTRGLSGKEFVTDNVRLEILKGRQKVMKFFRDSAIGLRNAEGLKQRFGEAAGEWLSEQGIRDYGFSPKVERTESTDVYMSKELNVKIKGVSSLPAVAATVAKREEGKKKLNNGDLIILWAYDQVKSELDALDKDQVVEYLDKQTKATIQEVRKLNARLSRVMYGVVVAHAWFADLDFEETKVSIAAKDILPKEDNIPSDFWKVWETTSFECEIVLEEKEVKI